MKKSIRQKFVASAALLVLATYSVAHAQDNGTGVSRPSQLNLGTCFVMLIDDVDVPARETGPLVAMHVQEGLAVSQNDLLAKIDDQIVQRKRDEVEAKLQAALKKAESTVEIDYATAAYQVAEKEFEINRELRKKNSISLIEYERSALAKTQAHLSIDKTRNDLAIEQLTAEAQRVELEAVNDSIGRHQIVSPLDGNVMEIYKQAGEWVETGEKVLRVVRMNRLRVQGYVEAAKFNPAEIQGRRVTVVAQLAHDRTEVFHGHVAHVGLEKRGGSQFSTGSRYQIWAEVENRIEDGHWLLMPGADVELTIDLASAAVTAGQNVQPAR
jgi:multidrug resistance efflux pump